ncbi:MAG: hypothetical protein GWN61_17725 [candidate division Zixibacteria bacterium]|nr:hypothetical protein [Phycisphaerae bacterium]NIR66078.1 hypothetical protein [candidate division Zixibacteria bacterium]NIW47225.1 hypothetical protein [Gammaproteobacteria bacterium]NIU15812.1 hypothetical protein [candidate division Zixibacteria bacterium]NIV07959.1 hypothetical protein [candidate division Zixibacteria bacterium]
MQKILAVVLVMTLSPPETTEGGITFYYGEPFEGSPLKCPGYRYEKKTGPWLAVDISWYESGKVQCGDWFLIEFYDGSRMFARALDSGYLNSADVWDTGLPFVADLPKYWRDGRETRTGKITNISAFFRDGFVR